MSELSEANPPTALAMIVCDYVYNDPATGKKSLLGMFSNIAVRKLPALHQSTGVFVSLTDGRGKVKLKLRLIDAEEKRPAVFEAETEIEFADPRMTVELVLQTPPITFPEAGEYRLQLFAGSHPVIERRLQVSAPPAKPPGS